VPLSRFCGDSAKVRQAPGSLSEKRSSYNDLPGVPSSSSVLGFSQARLVPRPSPALTIMGRAAPPRKMKWRRGGARRSRGLVLPGGKVVAATGRRAGARRSQGLVLPGGKVVAARPAAELELGVPRVWCSQYEPRSGAILGYFILSAPPNGAQSETLPCLNQAGSCSWSLSSGSRHHSVSAFPSPATRSKP
jgi:hypothetical protein